MPHHPADHPLAAAAIVRALSNQLQKAKAAGDEEAASVIQAVLDRAQAVVKRSAAHQHIPGCEPPRRPLPAGGRLGGDRSRPAPAPSGPVRASEVR